ncbi:hypothetical protein EG328_010483 [Venturia inaequalis]|uniref:Uncharacterized protein n=1 Tax=Venturia inaequalis TaxID=5025 RepID=A0A8H3UKK7_VENIN|nr:hypothetical protein EG328_010483 [Venturia inaequalis]KAE9971016.1 hypothetical protein EG327_010018 [Venturia inaequalis]
MPVQFGFSVGDFFAAAGVLYQLIKAFDSIDGAQASYKSQLAYLKGLHMVCEYISRNHSNLGDGLVPHANTVWDNYLKLHKHLSKYPTLAPRDANSFQDPNQVKKASETLRLAFFDIMGKVKKMQDSAMDAVAIVETYVVLELRDRIRSLEGSNGRQESGIAAASQDLQQIRVLTANLKQASEQNRDTLNKIKDSTDQQVANTEEICTKIEAMDKTIAQSQKELSESLGQLNKHIKEQREMAVVNKAADVQQWTNLQIEVGEEREELDSLKSSQEQLQSGLNESRKVLEGVSIITENQKLKRISGRLGGVCQILNPLGGIFGGGKPKAKPEPTPVRQDGPLNRNPNTERRVYNTTLSSSNQLPPRRNERTWSTSSAPVSRGKEPPEWGRRTIVIHPPPTMNTAQPTFQMGPVHHFQNLNQGQEMMEYLRHFQNLSQGQEMVELPPPLPTRPSGAPTVDSWLNTLPAASPLTKSISRSTAMQSLLVTSTTPPPLPPRRTSDASTVLSSATSIRSALTSSRSSTVSSPSPSPSPATAAEPAKHELEEADPWTETKVDISNEFINSEERR